MKRFSFCVFAILAVLGVSGTASAQVDHSALESRNQTSWGIVDPGNARTVTGFEQTRGFALAEGGGNIIVGGNFANVTNGSTTISQPHIAAFDVETGIFNPDFNPVVDAPVLALEKAADNGYFAGGEFRSWNGKDVSSIVKFNRFTGATSTRFNLRIAGGSAVVRDIETADDGWIYIAGSFTRAIDSQGGFDVDNVVRVRNATGTIDRTWSPETPGFSGLWSVSRSKTRDLVYLAGKSDSATNAGVIAVGSATGESTLWKFQMNHDVIRNERNIAHIYDVEATEFGTVFIAGTEHGMYVYNERSPLSLINNHVTSWDTRFDADITRRGGDYQDLTVVGDTVYAGCHCWGFHSSRSSLIDYRTSWGLQGVNATPTGRISAYAAYDARTGERDQSLDVRMAGSAGGWDMLVSSDGCIWQTGGYSNVGEIGDWTPARNLVRLCEEVPEPEPLVPPASCKALISGESVSVSWPAAANATEYVVHRTVDGSQQFWRGVVTGTSFTDTNADGDLTYYVTSRRSAADKSSSRKCVTEQAPNPAGPNPPASCNFRVVGDSVEVQWSRSAGAARYIVYRSVDGSQQFWRGAVDNVTTFTDTNRDASLEYYVLAVGADDQRSERARCAEGDAQPDQVERVSSCSISREGAGVKVSWPAVANQDAEYVISREVDNGTRWWRGRSESTSFVDSLRDGTFEYFVETKVGNNRSQARTCTPKLTN